MPQPAYDLCVIGGGSAGLVAAAGAATLGAKVVLVEKHRLGGDCLWTGCVPSKALLHAAKVAHTMASAERVGLPPIQSQVQLDQVMAYVRRVQGTIEPHDSPERFRELGVEVVFGSGQFTDPHTFRLEDRALTAKRFVIATGSRPAMPPITGIDQASTLTNETVFELSEAVPHLAVLGGGPIGVELAQAFARLGSQVTLIQRGPRILPKEDADVAAVIADSLTADGVTIHTGTQTQQVAGQTGALSLTLVSSQATSVLNISHLLAATGRRPNVEDLGLEAAGVEVTARGIITDRRLRTSQSHIYACGDVIGQHQFTHMAEHHAGVVLRNALFHLPAKVERRAIPWATFTEPEAARVGLSADEAAAQKRDYRTYTFPFEDIDRAQTDAATTGFAKLVTDPQGRLLGAAIVGPQAGELIQEYTLAIAKGMKAKDLSSVIHIYPTLAQINRRLADQHQKASLTPRSRRWLQWLFGLRGARAERVS